MQCEWSNKRRALQWINHICAWIKCSAGSTEDAPKRGGRPPLYSGINNPLVRIDFTSDPGIVSHANSAHAIVGHSRHFPCTARPMPAEGENERKEKKKLHHISLTGGHIIDLMTRHSTAYRYIYFYIQSRYVNHRCCPCLGLAAKEPSQTRRNRPTATAASRLWFLETNWNETHAEHTTNERGPPQTICAGWALVTLKCQQCLSHALMGWEGDVGRGSWQTQGNCELDFVFSQRVLRWAWAAAVRPRSRRHDVEIQGVITKGADHRIPVRCIPKANQLGNVHTVSFKQ